MKIVIAGNYGAKNLGDEMILEGLLQTIKNVAPEADIAVLSADPQETSSRHKVKSTHKFPAGIRSLLKFGSKAKKLVKECDYFILGGGGLFSNLTLRAYFIWGIQAIMAYRYGKPLIMYGQSVGPFNGKIQKFIAKKLFNKAMLIAVRDKESKEELKNLQIRGKIHVIPDLALNLKAPDIKRGRERKIIIAPRQMTGITAEFKKQLATFLNKMVAKGYKLEFANFQLPDDTDLTNEIISNIEEKDNITIMPQPRNADELFQHFASADFAVGMRLHSIIAAVKTNTPFLAVNYAPKVKNFLNYANLPDTILELNEANFEEKFQEINGSREALIKRLEDFNRLIQYDFACHGRPKQQRPDCCPIRNIFSDSHHLENHK